MAERAWRVELADSFLARLDEVEQFLVEADAEHAFDQLLAALRDTVFPNLSRFPRIGRRYLDRPPQSAEALAVLAQFPAGSPNLLREYLHGDYLLLYALDEAQAVVHLLSIRHHRELSFHFSKLWQGP